MINSSAEDTLSVLQQNQKGHKKLQSRLRSKDHIYECGGDSIMIWRCHKGTYEHGFCRIINYLRIRRGSGLKDGGTAIIGAGPPM